MMVPGDDGGWAKSPGTSHPRGQPRKAILPTWWVQSAARLPTLRQVRARRQTLESRLYHAAMTEQPRVNIPEWTVSELSAALKRTVEDAYGFVRVRGEISGYRGPHSSG